MGKNQGEITQTVSNEMATVTEVTWAYHCYQHMGARTIHSPESRITDTHAART